ncbi:MAG: DEAD/DEAH box helicase, partial [Candidatus Kapaibacteriota bacterium]
MFNFISKIFGGSKSERDVKVLSPIVNEINEYYEVYQSLSDEQLANKTNEFRDLIKSKTSELENEKIEIEDKLKNESVTPDELMALHDRIKQLEDEIFTATEEVLDDILPQAFATVKAVAKRLTDKKHTYEYAGNTSVWAMVPYDVQLIGGISLHQGKIAEMQTGEGKTLSAILPMYLNALPQKGVHLVTVNDYLAKRDCDWMKPVFDFLGITVGAIQANQEPDERAEIYKADITYGTNNEFGFDYLRDNMVTDSEQMVQRGHWFAMVDEVDSVLIDEARTPLIISGAVAKVDQRFEEMNPRIKRLVEIQTKYVNQVVNDFATKYASNSKEDKEEAGKLIFTAFRGMPKHKRLLKYLQEPEVQRLKHSTELFYLREQGRNMHEIDELLYFTVDEKNHQIDISEKGRELLCNDQEDPDMFLIPDIAAELSAIEGNKDLTPEEKQKQIDGVNFIYAERNDRIHTASQLLRAYTLYDKDQEYVIQEQKVMIVDEHTGRILDGRRYSDGLHQAIEAKENVKVERDTQTLATITLQNYFRMYNKLAGMTGTAATEAAEFEKIYSLEVVSIPTNRPMAR